MPHLTLNHELIQDTWTPEVEREVQQLKGPILILGASGFIGAKLFHSLSRRRADVYAGSSSIHSGWRLHFPWIQEDRLIACDLTNVPQIREVIQKIRPRTVFNLSAYGAYERQNQPEKIAAVNFMGVYHLLMILEELGCDALVQAGSSSEYGLNCSSPKESDELLPNSDYAVCKGAASLLIRYYGQIKNFPCVNLRLYSIYGPFEDPGRLIPQVIEKGLQNSLPPFADEKTSRDFVYIDDCTHAFVRAALSVCQTHRGASINIASGIKTTLGEIAALAKKIFHLDQNPSFAAMAPRKWDLSHWYGDPSLAQAEMSWKASTSLEEGLRLTAAWRKTFLMPDTSSKPILSRKKISMVIACYSDDQAIPWMHQRITQVFQKLPYDYEIIFVNDRSPKNDEAVIQALCEKDSHVVGISHSRNFGSQAAFVSGMEIATGDAVVLMDGDLQDPPELIPDLIEKWREGYEVVYGSRVKRQAKLHMQFFYKLFYRIFRTLSDIAIPIDAGDFSLIDIRCVKHLVSLPERDQFIRGLRAWIGFKQIGVPYVRPERAFGVSTNPFFKNIWWAKKGIFSFSTKPLHYIQALGVTLLIFSSLMILYYLINYFLHPYQNPRGTNTIIILTLGLGGVQILALSVIGDYIGKILEEVKGRPKFIRSKIFLGKSAFSSAQDLARVIRERTRE